jgi:hypothetical protein
MGPYLSSAVSFLLVLGVSSSSLLVDGGLVDLGLGAGLDGVSESDSDR